MFVESGTKKYLNYSLDISELKVLSFLSEGEEWDTFAKLAVMYPDSVLVTVCVHTHERSLACMSALQLLPCSY